MENDLDGGDESDVVFVQLHPALIALLDSLPPETMEKFRNGTQEESEAIMRAFLEGKFKDGKAIN